LLRSIGAGSPPRDFALYCERNFIERCFHKLRQFRAIATREDSLARHLLGVQTAAAIITAC
jgi:transposase